VSVKANSAARSPPNLRKFAAKPIERVSAGLFLTGLLNIVAAQPARQTLFKQP